MTIEKYLEGFKGTKPDVTTETFKLVARLVDELAKRGIDVGYIENIGRCEENNQRQIGDKYVGVKTVYRSNATSANTSVDIEVYVKVSRDSARRTDKVRVRVGASDKVIGKRIDEIAEMMA